MADTGDQFNQDELDNLLSQLDKPDQGGGGDQGKQSQQDIDRLVEEEMLRLLDEESKSKGPSQPQTSPPQTAARPAARPSDR